MKKVYHLEAGSETPETGFGDQAHLHLLLTIKTVQIKINQLPAELDLHCFDLDQNTIPT